MTVQDTPADLAVYRGMDQATLDAAYNNSAAVADSAARLATWDARSAAVRAASDARLDVVYGPRPRNRLDYFSCGKAAAPLFVFIHGGYWQRNDKDRFAFVAEGPRARGIDVAVAGYTLAPEAHLSTIVNEIAQALDFLSGQAGDLGFDSSAIVVGGWSAGGHLTAAAAEHPAVRGGLAISGIFDLEPIALSCLNDKLRLDAADIEALSPLRNLPHTLPPLRLCVGGDELPELQRQSAGYAEAARTHGLPVSLAVLPGHDHFSILEELGSRDGMLVEELVRLVAGESGRERQG
jgi:arylformamidase